MTRVLSVRASRLKAAGSDGFQTLFLSRPCDPLPHVERRSLGALRCIGDRFLRTRSRRARVCAAFTLRLLNSTRRHAHSTTAAARYRYGAGLVVGTTSLTIRVRCIRRAFGAPEDGACLGLRVRDAV